MAQLFKVSQSWQIIIRDLGLKPGDVLRRAGLPDGLWVRENATLTAEEYFRLWVGIEEEMGERAAALEIGQSVSVEAFDPPIFAALCSPDLNTAAQRLSHFKRLIGPLTLDVEVAPEQTALAYGSLEAGPLPETLGTAELVFLVQFARRATRTEIHPIQVTTPQPIRFAPRYEDFFGVRIRRGPTYRVVFSAFDAQRPFLTANAGMWQFFEPVLNQRLAEIEQEATIAERVYAALFEMLPSGRSAVRAVASTLGMSTRSLQRHLRREGTSFQKVLNKTREELARHYLRHSSMTGAEISFLLGYDDPNSFFRAFRTWTGQTPESLRASFAGMTVLNPGLA